MKIELKKGKPTNQLLTFNRECALNAFSKSSSDIAPELALELGAVKRATLEGRGGFREPADRVEPCVRALALLPAELTLSLSSYACRQRND